MIFNVIRILYNFIKLYNEDVQVLQPFESDIYELITHFLRRLTPPICFAAHNDNGFDYPIFLGELERIEKIIDLYITADFFVNFYWIMKFNNKTFFSH